MAAGSGSSVSPAVSSSPLHQDVVGQVLSLRGGPPAPVQNGGGDANYFPEEGKVRELSLQIHACLFQAQQLKLASVQQQPSAAANQQVSCIVV